MNKRIGVYNPNSRNRQRRRDEDLSPTNLTELERARIDVQALEIVLRSIPQGQYNEFRRTTIERLAAARARLADLQTPRECEEIQEWLSDHWDSIPEVEF